MSKNIIAEIAMAVKGGANLEDVIPLGADIMLWQRLVNNYNPNPKPRKRSHRGNSWGGKRSQYARMQSAVGWATVELVSRVNSIDPNWKRGHTANDEEEYGLETPRC